MKNAMWRSPAAAFLGLQALLISACSEAAGSPERFVYRPLLDPGTVMVIDATNKLIEAGHIGGRADFCKSDSPMICYSWGGIEFAVPRNISADRAPWNYEGSVYMLSGTARLVWYGKEEDVYLIDSRSIHLQDAAYARYVFGCRSGLIAISVSPYPRPNDRMGEPFAGPWASVDLLQGPKGFGHDQCGPKKSEHPSPK